MDLGLRQSLAGKASPVSLVLARNAFDHRSFGLRGAGGYAERGGGTGQREPEHQLVRVPGCREGLGAPSASPFASPESARCHAGAAPQATQATACARPRCPARAHDRRQAWPLQARAGSAQDHASRQSAHPGS